MKVSFKPIGLLFGLISIIISFLFFARAHTIYTVLWMGGIIFAIAFYLPIIFSKGSLKTKLIWTAVVVSFVVIQWLTEPYLIDSSYKIYIKQNEKTLAEVNHLLLDKAGEISILRNEIIPKDSLLTTAEEEQLITARKKLKTYLIYKTDKGIYYGLWGFMDVRLGIMYLNDNTKPAANYRHLTGKWYR